MTNTLLLPDAGPLITLAYAQSLDLLFKPGWPVCIVDMVMEEVTRNQTPTSLTIADWVKVNTLKVLATRTLAHIRHRQASGDAPPRKSNLRELAIQEAINDFALIEPPPTGVFLFEDHKIARSSFLLPADCRKVSTRAFLISWSKRVGWGRQQKWSKKQLSMVEIFHKCASRFSGDFSSALV